MTTYGKICLHNKFLMNSKCFSHFWNVLEFLPIVCNTPVDVTSKTMFVSWQSNIKSATASLWFLSFSIKFLLQFQGWHWHIYDVLTSKKDAHQKFRISVRKSIYAFLPKKIHYHISYFANKLEVLTSIIKQFFYTNLYILKKKTGLRIRWNVKLLVIKSFY